jgi:hypothetical protein
MPHGYDPDKLIRESPQLWQKVLAEAMTLDEMALLVALKKIREEANDK